METPCIVIDREVMTRNIQRMAELARCHGVALRPHVKTHKIPALAEEQLKAGAAGVTVAKVSEAEVMAASGIRDIFIAYPIVSPSKIIRVLALAQDHSIMVGVDSREGATLLSQHASEHKLTLKVRLEIDTGLKRTGVQPEEAVEFGQFIAELPGLELDGIFTFRGALLGGAPTLDLEQAGREEGRMMVEIAERMRESGVPIRHVSVGSTPTSAYAAAVEGVTEIRPGTYIFYDRMQHQYGVCGLSDIAAKVRATVVSVPSPTRAVIDGGSKTFATDVAPDQPPLGLKGFGEIAGHPEAIIERMNEEHGMVVSAVPHGWRVGDIVEVIPNHICSTVNLHHHVWIREEDGYSKVQVAGRGMIF